MRRGWWILVATAVAVAGCQPTETGPVVVEFSGPTMGTRYIVKIVTAQPEEVDLRTLQERVEATLAEVNSKMSHYEEDSEITRFNNSHSTEPFEASSEMMEILQLARQIGIATNSAFDITIAPLVNAWGFGPPGRAPEAPDARQIEALLDRVGWDRLELDASTSSIRKVDDQLTIDLSAIAKGFGVDRIVETLTAAGLDSFMVDIGGEVRAKGLNRDREPWRIGIERPLPGSRAIDLVLPLSDMSLATSGDYRNYYEIEGERISHMIDPRTGYPITHTVASVSVARPTCAEADAYATGLLVLGPDGFDLAERLGVAAYFLFRDSGEVFMGRMTTPFEELLEASESDRMSVE